MPANYPANDPTNASLLVARNNVSSTLNGGITNVATSATLASTSLFPSEGAISIESEIIHFTSNATATSVLSGLTRSAESTTAAAHADGVTVNMYFTSHHHNQIKDEVIAIGADLRNTFDTDLDDSVGATATASSLENRMDMISTRLASLGNSVDWKSGFPGKISQVIFATTDTSFTTGSTSFDTGNLSASITPNTTTSRILIFACSTVGIQAGTTSAAYFTLIRNTTTSNLGNANVGFGGVSGSLASNPIVPASLVYVDSPTTVAATTYALAVRTNTTTALAILGGIGPGNFQATQAMILAEIMA